MLLFVASEASSGVAQAIPFPWALFGTLFAALVAAAASLWATHQNHRFQKSSLERARLIDFAIKRLDQVNKVIDLYCNYIGLCFEIAHSEEGRQQVMASSRVRRNYYVHHIYLSIFQDDEEAEKFTDNISDLSHMLLNPEEYSESAITDFVTETTEILNRITDRERDKANAEISGSSL